MSLVLKGALVALLHAVLTLSAAPATASEDKFGTLNAQETTLGWCRDKRTTAESQACGLASMGYSLGRNNRISSDPKPGPTPQTQNNPRIFVDKLNGANLGVVFRLDGNEVVADLTTAQRENLGRAFRHAPDLLEKTAGDIDFDVNNKGQLTITNVYEGGPAAVVDNFVRMRNGSAPAFAAALATGDAAKVAETMKNAPAMRAAMPEPAQAEAQSSARGRLAGLLARLKQPAGSGNPSSAAAVPNAVGQATEAAPVAAPPTPTTKVAAVAPSTPSVANPFDTIKPDATGIRAPRPIQLDTLGGFPAVPQGAVWADLRTVSNDPEVLELSRIIAALATPDSVLRQRKLQLKERTSDVYAELGAFLARPRPAARHAEMVGRATMLIKSTGVTKADGSLMSTAEAFPQTNRPNSKIWLTLALAELLVGDAEPSAVKNSFAPSAAKPSSMDVLYLVSLPIFDATTATVVPMDRAVTFYDLLNGGLLQRNAEGNLVPAAAEFELQWVRGLLSLLGYSMSPGKADPQGHQSYRVTYSPKSGGSRRDLFDVVETKAALAAAGATALPPR